MTHEGRERPQAFDPVGRQVGVTARAMRMLPDGALATAGSTFADWSVLAALDAGEPLVQKDLAKSLGMIGDALRSTETDLTNGIGPRDLEITLRLLAQIADRARSPRTSGQASH